MSDWTKGYKRFGRRATEREGTLSQVSGRRKQKKERVPEAGEQPIDLHKGAMMVVLGNLHYNDAEVRDLPIDGWIGESTGPYMHGYLFCAERPTVVEQRVHQAVRRDRGRALR